MKLIPIVRAFALVALCWRVVILTATAACPMLPADAVAWWKLDQSTGEIISGLPGTLVGDAVFVPGYSAGALSLDGDGDLLSVPNSAPLQLQNFTIEAWIKRADLTGTSKDWPPSGTIFGGGAGSYALALGTDGLPILSHVGIGAALGGVAITDLEWHHVAVTKEGQLVRFYVDGAPAGIATYAQNYSFNTPFAVGALGAPYVSDPNMPQVGRWYGFWGDIDEVTVYSRPLGGDEIHSVFAAGATGKCTDDVSLTLVDAPPEANVGEPATVEIAVRNQNVVPVADVVVSTEISGVATGITATSSLGGCSVANGVVVCDVGVLPAGEGAVITLQLMPTTPGDCVIRSALGPVAGNGNPLNDKVEKTLEVLGGCTATPSGLVAWWRGENDGRDLLRLNDGIFPSGTPQFISGRVGQAFLFDGRQGYRVADSPGLHLQDFTIEAWVKRAALTASSFSTPPAGVVFGGSAGSYGLTIGADGTLILAHLGLDNVSGTGRITDLNWHHVALTRAGSAVRFFLDGQDAGVATYAGTFTFDGDFGIGAAGQLFSGFNYAFLGAVDELSVYSRALSPEEIKSIQRARSAGKCYEDISLSANSPLQATLGAESTYSLRVGNHGTQTATGVVVTNPIPAGATLVSATTATGTAAMVDGIVQWNVGTVEPGASPTLTVKVTLTQQGVISFSAGAIRAEPDLSPENNSVQFDIEAVGPCASAPSGLVAWLAGEGNYADELLAHDGTATGGVGIVAGHTGQGFVFDGTGEIAIANDAVFQGPGFSVEGWVYPTKLDGREDMIVTQESLGFQPPRFLISVRGQSYPTLGTIPYGNLAFLLGGLGGVPNDDAGWIDGHAPVPVGKWSHVALTYGDGVARVYVNGVLSREISGLTGALAKVDGPIRIGSRRPDLVGQAGEDRFNGRIDEFSYYGRALSSGEIAAINTSSTAGKCHGPVPVTIVSPPANQTVFVGANVSFSVGAAGTPAFTYLWRSNDVEIAGATTATLSLPAVKKAATGRYSVTVCNPAGCAPEVAAILTVRPPPAELQILQGSVKSPGLISVPILLTSNGDENAISFSLRFDPRLLSYVGAAPGVAAPGAQLLVNTAHATQGNIGLALALTAGATLSEGLNEVLRVNFQSVLSPTDYSVLLSPTDSPIARQLADTKAILLPADWGSGGLIQVFAADYEGDVMPRPNGDKILNVSDWVQVGRLVAALDEVAAGPEFQRADCAPIETSGDGRLSVSDWVQSGRFAAGLDAPVPAAGPTEPTPPAGPARSPRTEAPAARTVHFASASWLSGRTNEVQVQLEAVGDENAVAFSVTFDPAALEFIDATPGTDAKSAALNVNDGKATDGRLGLALALGVNARIQAGTREMARLRFRPRTDWSGSTGLVFDDSPVYREIADPLAHAIPGDWQDASFIVASPTLAFSRIPTEGGWRIELAWPATLGTAILETSGGLEGTGWAAVQTAPVPKNDLLTVTLAIGEGPRYFRLHLP